MTAVQNLMY